METTRSQVPVTNRSTATLTAAAGAIFLVVAIVFAANTNWYQVFKMIHVLAAVAWVGGGTLVTLAALAFERAKNPDTLFAIGKIAEWAAMRIFVPSGVVALVFGMAMMANGDIPYDQFWVLFALLGWAASFVWGVAVLRPKVDKLNALADERGRDDPETQATLRSLLVSARFDVVLLLLIVLDMTAKPFA
jgi:uncharacterized membrane protein